MKVGKKISYLGIVLLICSFLATTIDTQAKKPNNIVIQFEQAFLGFGPIDEWSVDDYGVIYYKNNVIYVEISTEDCPLQGIITQTITSYVNPGIFGLGVWYNSFEGTYNGEEARYEGWTCTYQAVGYGLYLGHGALDGYLVKYTIDGTTGVVINTIELIQRDMKNNIDFEFSYAVDGLAGMYQDDSGFWFFDDVQHSGTITSASKKYFSGDIYFGCDLYLLDEFPAMTTFNSIGYGSFEFDGYFKHRSAGFIGTMGFLFRNWEIMGLILAEGTGYLAGCLITGFVTGFKDGPCYVQMSIFRLH